jgi:aspartate/tyrosine/aromatic aminotransferase
MLHHLAPSRRQLSEHDPIFTLDREAGRLREEGRDVLNATAGVLQDDGGGLVVLDAARELWTGLTPADVAPYHPLLGQHAFVEAMARRLWPGMERVSLGCATPGGTGALITSLLTFLEPGMALLAAAPHWGPYGRLASIHGLTLRTAPFPGPGQPLDEVAWEEAISGILEHQGRLLLWLNDPCHNPTGWTLEPDQRAGLLGLLRRYGALSPVTVILDCPYLDYTRDPRGAAEALEDYARLGEERTVLVGAALSISKALTLYGARGGALALPWFPSSQRALLQETMEATCMGNLGIPPRLPQSLMLRLEREGRIQERLVEEHRHWSDVLECRATALGEALKGLGLPGVIWKGGFFTLIPAADPVGLSMALKALGVYAVPQAGGLRVGLCGLPAAQAPRFARALKAALA